MAKQLALTVPWLMLGGGGDGGLIKEGCLHLRFGELIYFLLFYCWGEGLFLKGLIFGINFYDPMTE